MNNEDSLQNDTKTHRMRVVEQSKWVQGMNKVGPRNVGTVDVNLAYLVRPINDPSKFCQIPNNKKTTEQRIEEELDLLSKRGVFAANADTEDVYSAVEKDGESKKVADNGSDEDNLL